MFISKKIQVGDLIGALMSHLYFFLEVEIFSFPQKIVGSSEFQKNLQRLDQPTLVFFFAFLKKLQRLDQVIF